MRRRCGRYSRAPRSIVEATAAFTWGNGRNAPQSGRSAEARRTVSAARCRVRQPSRHLVAAVEDCCTDIDLRSCVAGLVRTSSRSADALV
jgi:hypothetical protein